MCSTKDILRMKVIGDCYGWIHVQFWAGEGTAEIEFSADSSSFFSLANIIWHLWMGKVRCVEDIDVEGYEKRVEITKLFKDRYLFEIRGERAALMEESPGYYDAFNISEFDKDNLLDYEIDFDCERELVESNFGFSSYGPVGYFPRIYIRAEVSRTQAVAAIFRELRDFWLLRYDPQRHGDYHLGWKDDLDVLDFTTLQGLLWTTEKRRKRIENL